MKFKLIFFFTVFLSILTFKNLTAQTTTAVPMAYFTGKSGGEISAASAKSGQGIIVRRDDKSLEEKFQIVAFELSVVKNGNSSSAVSGTYQLTTEQKAILSKVTPGCKIIISGIKIKTPEGTVRTIKTISFKVY